MNEQALKLWQAKKQYLESVLAIATNAAQQFELRHQIAECDANNELPRRRADGVSESKKSKLIVSV